MASLRRLNPEEEEKVSILLSESPIEIDSNGLQVDIAISMVSSGGVTIISDNDEVRTPQGIINRLESYFGRSNLEIIALKDNLAKEFGVRQPAYAVKLRGQQE